MADNPQPASQPVEAPVQQSEVRPLNVTSKATKKPELEDTYVIDVAGNISTVKTVKGERPKPGSALGPVGTRVATKEEIDAYKAAGGQ
jgi:hypothetical protein